MLTLCLHFSLALSSCSFLPSSHESKEVGKDRQEAVSMTTGKSAKRWLGSQRKSGFSPFPCFFGSPPSLGVWSPRQACTAVTRFNFSHLWSDRRATMQRRVRFQLFLRCCRLSLSSSLSLLGPLSLSPQQMIHKSCFQLSNNSGHISGVCLLSRVPCSSLHRNMGQ